MVDVQVHMEISTQDLCKSCNTSDVAAGTFMEQKRK